MLNDNYTICYIDESSTSATDFAGNMQDYFNVELVVVKDNEPLDELIERIKSVEFQYLAVDYHLNQDINVEYDGDSIIQVYLSEFKDFPHMLISSDARGAINVSEGVIAGNIYDKDEVYNPDRRDNMISKINKSINDYKDRLLDAERKYKALIEKQNVQELTLQEEEEATKLNELIDSSIGDSSHMPPITVTNGIKLNELISKTDQLLEKIENNA